MPKYTEYIEGLTAVAPTTGDKTPTVRAGVAHRIDEPLTKAVGDSQYAPLGGVAPRTMAWFPGVTGNYHTAPHAAGMNVAGDMEWVVRVQRPSYAMSANEIIAAKRTSADGLSWQVGFSSASALLVGLRTGGVDRYPTVGATSALTGGVAYWIRVRYTAATGSVSSWYSAADTPEPPTSWTSWATTTTHVSGGVDANAAAPEVASTLQGSSGPLAGGIGRVIVRDGFDGSAVIDWRADAPWSPRFRDVAGNIWTPTGSAWAWSVEP